MKPLIGITSGEVVNKEHPWTPYVFGQSHTYCEAVVAAGGIPVILPFMEDINDINQLVSTLDGLMLAGGNDVDPALYHQAPSDANEVSPARDAWEVKLMTEAEKHNIPILAICRGMQLLNVVRSGSLYQDINKEVRDAQSHSSSDEAKDIEHFAHTLHIEKHSKLEGILGDSSIRTNSHHHQAIKLLGNNLVVNARAEDGIIEGVEDPGAEYIVGVQSHPESLFQRVETGWKKLFASHIEAATNYRTNKN